MSETRSRAPGLTVLALLNLLYFLAVVAFFLGVRGGKIESPGGLWTSLPGLLAGLLAVLSAAGFLLRSRLLGYITGNAFAGFLLVYAVGFLASKGTVNPMEYFAWLSYPAVMLFALNFLYRSEFESPRATGGQETDR